MPLSLHLLQDWKKAREMTGTEVEFTHTPCCSHVLSGCHLKHGVVDPDLPPSQMQGLQFIKIVSGTSKEGD